MRAAWILVALALTTRPAAAGPTLSGGVVRVGVLTDLSGPWAAMGGLGSVQAARMAAHDCQKAECKGMTIEIVSFDHRNDLAAAEAQARKWLEHEGVDAIADLTNSGVALAVQRVARPLGRITLFSGPGATGLTRDECSPTGFHWMFDTWALSAGTARAVTLRGGKTWFFLTVDYAFGLSLERDASEAVVAAGGKVVGSTRHPLDATDFSPYLLEAQASRAQVIGLANGGPDAVNAIKQAREFGIIDGGQRVVPLLVFLTDVHSLGLSVMQGLSYVDGFYWDMDAEARAWSKRFRELHGGAMPTMVQAGVYSSVLHYLRAVATAGTDDGPAVARAMRRLPIRDPVLRHASIRADGRVLHDMYLVTAKAPHESRGDWDYLRIVSTIPAKQAFAPLDRAACRHLAF